jgi:hypothetical protein
LAKAVQKFLFMLCAWLIQSRGRIYFHAGHLFSLLAFA